MDEIARITVTKGTVIKIFVEYVWIDDCGRVFVHTDVDPIDFRHVRYKNEGEAESAAIKFCKNYMKKYSEGLVTIKYKVFSVKSVTKILSTKEFENRIGIDEKRNWQQVFEKTNLIKGKE